MIFWMAHRYLVISFENEIRKRAETIASTIIYTSDASQDPRQIQRLVTTLNLERDVNLIVAITGDPPKVFASSRVQWVDKPLSILHQIPDCSVFIQSLESDKEFRYEKRAENSFLYIVSFNITWPRENSGLLGKGALLVELDVTAFMGQLFNAVMLMTISLVLSISLIAFFTYLIIRKNILRPAMAMQTVMNSRAAGDLQARVPVFSHDEIGSISQSLNQMLDQLDQESTRRSLIEQRLRESESKLLEMNSSKDKFFSLISHDLKSPFNAILGFSHLLQSEYNDLSPQQRLMFIDRIVDGLTQVYKLLENLLEWSRIQLGGIEFRPESLDIGLMVFEIARVNKLTAEKKQIGFSIEIHDRTFVYCDKNMLNTILRNLISNAIKFSKPGGSIKIRTVQFSESDRIPKGFIGVAVADEGIGIAPTDLGSLFKIDSGFHRKGTSNESGTGLGLVLCKEFIETYGGTIWAESDPGNGSTFIFTVPLS